MKHKTLAFVALLASVPTVAAANTATSQSVVTMTVQGSSCSVSSNGDPNFGVITNPITTLQEASGSVYISCGASSPAIKIAFNDAGNTGTFNFTMTNSTTTTATETYQICDSLNFNGTTCASGFEYHNTTSDEHAIGNVQSTSYGFVAYFVPPAGGVNLAGGTYFDTVTETISF